MNVDMSLNEDEVRKEKNGNEGRKEIKISKTEKEEN